MRYGLNELLKNNVVCLSIQQSQLEFKNVDDILKFFNENKNNIIKTKTIIEELKNFFLNDLVNIARHIGNLYDYPHKLIFNLAEIFHTKNNISNDKIKAYFEKYFPNADILQSHSNFEVYVTRMSESALKNTITKHMIFINTAYPCLTSEALFEDIRKTFLTETV
ncbi:MAG: hypothetical protein ACK4PR_14130, partial [Gammaproteobacteria bacterium]